MEYTFRNSAKENEVGLKLGVHAIEIFSGSTVQKISYEEITEVILNRSSNLYFIAIQTLHQAPLTFTNISYKPTGEQIDQSRAYMTFVRVLHVHLYGKNKISFRTGSRKSKLMLCIAGFAGITVLSSLSAYYLNQFRMVPLYIVGLLIIPGFILLYRLRPSQWPKSYDPASLPIQFLPPTV